MTEYYFRFLASQMMFSAIPAAFITIREGWLYGVAALFGIPLALGAFFLWVDFACQMMDWAERANRSPKPPVDGCKSGAESPNAHPIRKVTAESVQE
jgi:hypothetical protein